MRDRGIILKAAGLVALAVSARMAAVFLLRSYELSNTTFEHGEIAANLMAGRGFSIHFLGADGPTSQQAPAYPLMVAAAFALGGIDSPASLLALQLAQCFLGGVLVLAVLWLSREVLPEAPAAWWLAGLLTALHPTLVYAATHVQVAGLAATLLTLSLAQAYRTGRTGRARDALFLGLSLAGAALADPILALCGPGAVWAIALKQPCSRAWLRLGAIAFLTAALGISPWIVRNYHVHGEFVPIKSTFGYAFWQGNCRQSEGTDKVVRASVEEALGSREPGLSGMNRSLWEARHKAGYIDDVALTQADYAYLKGLSEPERSRVLLRRAIQDLRAQPERYVQLSLRRLRYFVLFDETNPKTRNLLYRASHLGLTALALLGIAGMGRSLRRDFAPTFLTALLITVFHGLTIVSARFHIPLEPMMGIWAAAGLVRWVGVDGRTGDVGASAT